MKKAALLIILPLLFFSPGYLFSQNPRVNGYRGIWFSTGPRQEYGYKLSGGVATFGSRHRPIAVYSEGAEKTFFVYGGTTDQDERHLLIMASYFDHRSGKVPKPVIVYDKMGVKEPYDNSSLTVDVNGYIWIFVSGYGRTRPGLIFRSNSPYSIDGFEMISEMEMVSPQPWSMDEKGFVLFYSKTGNGSELFCSSSISGKDWSDSRKLASMGGHLQISESYGGRIATAFNYFPGGDIDRQTNLYLMLSDDNGNSWKTIESRRLQIPLREVENEALLKNFEKEGKLVHLSDIDFDSNGDPVILIIVSKGNIPGPVSGPREWFVVYRKDNEWVFSKVCESTHNFDRGAIDIKDDEWRVIGPTEPGPQKYGTGGEIALWTSSDNGHSWEKKIDVTMNSINNNSFVRNPDNVSKEFFALWTDGNSDEFSRSYLYFTNEKCNKVWMLPYEMEQDFQKPLRIR
ncbi:MAG: BNR-4 repeat-containing protein [Bacteroidales bacterium]|jgi:hypothetical protein|nr:BNR-4 repeat-containing protein [Bacteroidales bacterium]